MSSERLVPHSYGSQDLLSVTLPFSYQPTVLNCTFGSFIIICIFFAIVLHCVISGGRNTLLAIELVILKSHGSLVTLSNRVLQSI